MMYTTVDLLGNCLFSSVNNNLSTILLLIYNLVFENVIIIFQSYEIFYNDQFRILYLILIYFIVMNL